MNVGDYVRTKDGRIIKVENYNEQPNNPLFETLNGKAQVKGTIIKSSPDIIDLVELGDIVKIEFGKDDSNVFEVVAIDKNNNEIGIFNNNFEFDWVGLEQLKSIVTKEQFSSMEYKI